MSIKVAEAHSRYLVENISSGAPVGYKQTEVGIIPEDWLVEPLENFTSFISYGFTNPMPTVFSGPYMITARDISASKIQYKSARNTSIEAFNKLLTAKSKPQKNDLLLTKDGTLGRLALVEDELICINQSVAILRPNSRIAPSFFLVLLESPFYQNRMIEDAGGSTIKHIYITIVNRMLLGVPSCQKEQTAIANALSDVDALIQELEKLIVKKQAIKTATMQQLLTGRTRLPQFAHHPDGRKKGHKPSELGEIPEDWELMPLGELTELIRNGSNYKTISKDGVPVSRIETIAKGFIDFDRTGIASEESIHASYKLKGGDILYSHINSVDHIGKVAMYESDRPLYHGINLLLIRVDQNTSSNWLYSYLSFSPSREWAKKIAKQAVSQASINTKELKQLVISTPAFDEQEAIGLALKEFDLELELCKFRLDKTRQIKQGMMQELLTGKTRLVKPAEPA